MKKLMIRADDLGYSKGINYGIYESVKNGVIKNIGFMVNMPNSVEGYNLVKDYDICLGQHTNVCVGRPICNPSLIPSLVQENGEFKPSRMYRTSKVDFVVIEEAVLEIEAQYERFKIITGQEPRYFEAHAVQSDNLMKALKIVADRHGLKFCDVSFDGTPIIVNGQKMYMWMDGMNPDYNPLELFKKMHNEGHEDGYDMMVCHPGFLDDYILTTSSLTNQRTKEVEMLCSDELRQYMINNDIRLYKYDEV